MVVLPGLSLQSRSVEPVSEVHALLCAWSLMISTPSQTLSSPFLRYLQELRTLISENREGEVATYIPELARANPDWFGICVVTAAGNVYEVGDTGQTFTIQSISKPFVYGLALEDYTRADVLTKVGVEPTGDAFNAISLEEQTGRPRNPMINAGAIATVGMVAGMTPEVRLQRILHSFSLFAGRELNVDESVYQSEAASGHRNRAIGHMLRNFDILTVPPDPVVDLYFKQCSVAVTCRDLGIMAATLANQGVNPLTHKQAIRGEYVESVLSVMASSGMYDYAGEWLYRIGMPAKSGVAGGVIAVLPGQLGIGVFSPPLDAQGNSVRGIEICDALSRSLDLHLFNVSVASRSVIRLRFAASSVGSNRKRAAVESELIRESGDAIQLYQLQGDLVFATCDLVVQKVLESLDDLESLILDLKHVPLINESACRQLYHLCVQLEKEGKRMLFSRAGHLNVLRRYMRAKLQDRFQEAFRTFDDNDLALEWCENHWLKSRIPPSDEASEVPVESYDILRGLSSDDIAELKRLLKLKQYRRGEVMVEFGAEADEVYFIRKGTASIAVPVAGDGQRRLALFSPGMSFGEIAMLDHSTRSAIVIAETEIECHLLKRGDFESLAETHPHIKITLLRNMALEIAGQLRRVTRAFSIFDY